MPIPEYQQSSGAIIYRMTPEEKVLATATKDAQEAKTKNKELQDNYNKLESKFNALLDLVGDKLGISEEDLANL